VAVPFVQGKGFTSMDTEDGWEAVHEIKQGTNTSGVETTSTDRAREPKSLGLIQSDKFYEGDGKKTMGSFHSIEKNLKA